MTYPTEFKAKTSACIRKDARYAGFCLCLFIPLCLIVSYITKNSVFCVSVFPALICSLFLNHGSKPLLKPKKFMPFFLLGLAAVPVSLVFTNLAVALFKISYAPTILPESAFLLCVYIISKVLAVPFLEEYLFRGLLLDIFKKHGEAFAIIFTSILFSLLHADFVNFIPAFLGGIIFGFIALKSESFIVSFASHSFYNLFSIVSTFFRGGRFTDITVIISAAVLFLISITAFFITKRQDEKFYRLTCDKQEIKKYVYAFTEIPILIFIAISIYFAVLNIK